ncbi:UDP-N-acetylmuramoyl-L-alanyl-D-glutamate--2,6-diaminopimelate ligase [uncultured Helicobacter sp.]|uniref:UDP-N-acetylmuramoyl-L-alanyl-D-glutamate--2, 6-diaminopimelate ligase n=1 Tax=uncultured Helicobacter sp. TaxID=175537 RepID=UPI00374FCC8B
MLITKNITYHNRDFSAITDDTKCIDSRTLFVKTKQNERYFSTLEPKPPYIHAHDLGEIFAMPKCIIGITGTNGKTTTATIIYESLRALGFNAALLGTRGFFINGVEMKPKGLTTPGVLELYEDFELAKECAYFVMEVSSHAIVQERIAGVEFGLKILSNITSDHLDFHKSLQEYIRVKNSFFALSSPKLINADEINAHYNPANAYTYGIESSANMRTLSYDLHDGIRAQVAWSDTIQNNDKNTNTNAREMARGDLERTILEAKLFGKHNLYNALAALSALKILTRKPLDSLAHVIAQFEGVSGRMEILSHRPLIIVDFAHTHDGMEQIFQSFLGRKIVVLFGAGGDRDTTKRPKMGAVADKYAHRIYLTSDNPRSENPDAIIAQIAQGVRDKTKIIIESNRKKAIESAIKDMCDDEVLLVLGKGDESYQIIGDNTLPFDDREIIKALIQD